MVLCIIWTFQTVMIEVSFWICVCRFYFYSGSSCSSFTKTSKHFYVWIICLSDILMSCSRQRRNQPDVNSQKALMLPFFFSKVSTYRITWLKICELVRYYCLSYSNRHSFKSEKAKSKFCWFLYCYDNHLSDSHTVNNGCFFWFSLQYTSLFVIILFEVQYRLQK